MADAPLADVPISGLPVGTPVSGGEAVAVVQNGKTVQVTTAEIAGAGSGPIYNTENFKKQGDPSYTQAINRAADALNVAGLGGTVFIPASATPYIIGDSLEPGTECIWVYSNMTLAGAGSGQTVLRRQDGSTGNTIRNFTGGCTNVCIRDLEIDGNGDNVNSGDNIRFQDVWDFRVSNVIVRNPKGFGIAHFGTSAFASGFGTLEHIQFIALPSEGVDFHVGGDVVNQFTAMTMTDLLFTDVGLSGEGRPLMNLRCEGVVSNVKGIIDASASNNVTLITARGSCERIVIDNVTADGPFGTVVLYYTKNAAISNVVSTGGAIIVVGASNAEEDVTGNGSAVVSNIHAQDAVTVLNVNSDNNIFTNIFGESCGTIARVTGSYNFMELGSREATSDSTFVRVTNTGFNNYIKIASAEDLSTRTMPIICGQPTIIDYGSNILPPIVVNAANKSLAQGDMGKQLLVTTGNTNRLITAPLAGLAGRRIPAFKSDSGTGDVNMSDGTNIIAQITAQYGSAALYDDGVEWVPILGGIAPTPPPPPSPSAVFADFTQDNYTVGPDVSSFAALFSVTRTTPGAAQNVSGLWTQFLAGEARLTDKGLLSELAATNSLLWNRDLANAAWVKGTVTTALDQPGIFGATAASSALATASNSTFVQFITLGAATRTFSFFIKSLFLTGRVWATVDGSTFVDITSQVGFNYSRVFLPMTAANPIVGIRIENSGDSIAFDCAQVATGSAPSSPIITTTVAVTRNADVVVMITPALISLATGTNYAEWSQDYLTGVLGRLVYPWSTSSANRVVLGISSTANGTATVTNASSDTFTHTSDHPATAAANFRSGLSYTAGAQINAYSVSMQTAVTLGTGAIPTGTCDGVGIGCAPNGIGQPNAYIRRVQFNAVADTQAQVLVWVQGP